MKSLKLHIVIFLLLGTNSFSFGQNYFDLREAKLIKSGISTGLFSNVKQAFGAPTSESNYYSEMDNKNLPQLMYGTDEILCWSQNYDVFLFSLNSGMISFNMDQLTITPNSQIDLNEFQTWGYEYNLVDNETRITIVFPPTDWYVIIDLLPVRGGTASERRIRSIRLGFN